MKANNYLDVLNKFLTALKERKCKSALVPHLQQFKLITNDFEDRYLNSLGNDLEKVNILRREHPNENTVLIYLQSLDKSLYRVEVTKEVDWSIRSFRFQCPGCFGEDELCNVCGGSGWGVL